MRRSPLLSGEVESRTEVMRRKLRNRKGGPRWDSPRRVTMYIPKSAAGEIAGAPKSHRKGAASGRAHESAGAGALRQSRASKSPPPGAG
ncbi:BZ3501_MvSof-1269-A2-R1_C59g00330 [Microbotryum saponariae]|nr:BZ3501_MvSof-1269-A2-R1_C59g00330 [Microbotryum saponariae]